MYADKITDSMREAIDETDRRRVKQVEYNEAHGVDPQPLRKKIADILDQVYSEADDTDATVDVGGSGRNASRGRRAQGEPGRAVSADPVTTRRLRAPSPSVPPPTASRSRAGGFRARRARRSSSSPTAARAARIRDEIADLKKELRGMDAAGLK